MVSVVAFDVRNLLVQEESIDTFDSMLAACRQRRGRERVSGRRGERTQAGRGLARWRRCGVPLRSLLFHCRPPACPSRVRFRADSGRRGGLLPASGSGTPRPPSAGAAGAAGRGGQAGRWRRAPLAWTSFIVHVLLTSPPASRWHATVACQQRGHQTGWPPVTRVLVLVLLLVSAAPAAA